LAVWLLTLPIRRWWGRARFSLGRRRRAARAVPTFKPILVGFEPRDMPGVLPPVKDVRL
jgi:hypothetical protein